MFSLRFKQILTVTLLRFITEVRALTLAWVQPAALSSLETYNFILDKKGILT